MINKKKMLGKTPSAVNLKDAVHVAIISVVVGDCLSPGDPIRFDVHGRAIKSGQNDCFGFVDVFASDDLSIGDKVWCMVRPDLVQTVEHTWDCEFDVPSQVEVKKNQWLEEYANKLKVPYEELMQACDNYVYHDKQTDYTGGLSSEELDALLSDWRFDLYDMWSQWEDERGYEFPNYGTICCPETEYPEDIPFKH